MYDIKLKNIINQKEEWHISLPLIPRVGETLQLQQPNKFLLVHGITYVIENETTAFDVFVEPIDRTYWMNEI